MIFLFTMMIFQSFVKFTGWYWDCKQPSHDNFSLDFNRGSPPLLSILKHCLFLDDLRELHLRNPPTTYWLRGKIGTVWRKATSSGCFWYCGWLRNPAPVDSWNIYMIISWMIILLVGGFSPPLWKMMDWKSVGMMIIPNIWKNKSHVPNHQPV